MLKFRAAVAVAIVAVALLAIWQFYWMAGNAGTPPNAPPNRPTDLQTEAPASEPERFPSAASDAERRGFRDVALESGFSFRMNFLPGEQGETFKINLYDHGCGVAIGDYNGDGHDDVYFLNELGTNALFRNNSEGTFVDVTAEAGVALGDRISVGASFGDYDHDGDQDLYVTSTRGGNVLFQNQADGRFQDVTSLAGLSLVAHSQGAAWFDYDNDGYLDLFVANTAEWTYDELDDSSRYFVGKGGAGGFERVITSPKEQNVLYRNNQDGTFVDVTKRAGLAGMGWAGDVAVLDLNEDDHLDLLVTNMFGPSQLYRNNRDGTFSDVTIETLGRTPWGGMGAKALDMNNDGRLDLLIVDMHSDMWMGPDFEQRSYDMAREGETTKYQHVYGPLAETDASLAQQSQRLADRLGYRADEVVYGNTFFKNLGSSRFREISSQANMETFWPWGVATGDFDNNGYEDVFLPSGMGYPFYYWPNYLMMNNGDETFANRSREQGIDPPVGGMHVEEQIGGKQAARSSRAAAVADFDRDGRLDLVVNNFNDRPYYYKNNFPRKNYVAFRLRGTRSNWDAIGAVVRVYGDDEVMTRQVHPAGGYLAQSSKTLYFGLGDRSKIDRAEIRWPSGTLQRIENPGINTLHRIAEAGQ